MERTNFLIEANIDTLRGFYKSLLNAHRAGEAMVSMRGRVSDEFRMRALSREDMNGDPKKALAEQYLEDMGRLGEFRVDVVVVEGCDVATYWFVRNDG